MNRMQTLDELIRLYAKRQPMGLTQYAQHTAPKLGPLMGTGQTHPITRRPVMTDGEEMMTEYTATLDNPMGGFSNVPTIWNGQIQDDQTALWYALQKLGGLKQYADPNEAAKDAEFRSTYLGQYLR